jgi:signal transduction histidine kinase
MISPSEYDKQGVRVTVMTTAVGFSAEVRSGSSGIGMALSTSISDAHRGGMWAEPNNSYGAPVQFTLPMYQTIASR